MSGLRILLCSLALFASGASSYALDTQCVSRNLLGMLGIVGKQDILAAKVEFGEYAAATRLLFLGDGTRPEWDLMLGSSVARQFPEKEVVRSDFAITETTKAGNLTAMHLDHSAPFPFPDNSFDSIVLRRGLCICHEGRTCAGMCPASPEMKRFFSEVARVLDKTKPEAQAVLHGSYNVDDRTIAIWKNFAIEIEREFPVEFSVQMQETGIGPIFHSIVIRPRASGQP